MNGMANDRDASAINVALQCLLRLPGLREYFLQNYHMSDMFRELAEKRLSLLVGDLFKVNYSVSKKALDPIDLCKIIANEMSQNDPSLILQNLLSAISFENRKNLSKKEFSDYSQELFDSERQRLEYLLTQSKAGESRESLLEELSLIYWMHFIWANNSVVSDALVLQLLAVSTCPSCKHTAYHFEHQTVLNCEAPKKLEQCSFGKVLENTFSEKTQAKRCLKCSKEVKMKLKKTLFKTPPILMCEYNRIVTPQNNGNVHKALINIELRGEDISRFVRSTHEPENQIYVPFMIVVDLADPALLRPRRELLHRELQEGLRRMASDRRTAEPAHH